MVTYRDITDQRRAEAELHKLAHDQSAVLNHVPDTPLYQTVEPIYENWPGWPEHSTNTVRTWTDLPDGAQRYLKRIEELVGVPIKYVSVGPEREEMFEL